MSDFGAESWRAIASTQFSNVDRSEEASLLDELRLGEYAIISVSGITNICVA